MVVFRGSFFIDQRRLGRLGGWLQAKFIVGQHAGIEVEIMSHPRLLMAGHRRGRSIHTKLKLISEDQLVPVQAPKA